MIYKKIEIAVDGYRTRKGRRLHKIQSQRWRVSVQRSDTAHR